VGKTKRKKRNTTQRNKWNTGERTKSEGEGRTLHEKQMACGQRMIEWHQKKRKKENNGVANDKVGIGRGGYLE